MAALRVAVFFAICEKPGGADNCPPAVRGLTLADTKGIDATPSGFPKITRERIGRSSRNLVHLTFEHFYIFPENFKSLPTMTFDLWPDFQGHV